MLLVLQLGENCLKKIEGLKLPSMDMFLSGLRQGNLRKTQVL